MSAADRTELPETGDEHTEPAPQHDQTSDPDPERAAAPTPAPRPADEADTDTDTDDADEENEDAPRTGWPVGQILLGIASVLTLGGLGLYQLAGWPGVAAGAAVPAAGGAAVARRWRDRHLPRTATAGESARRRNGGDGVFGGVLGGGSGLKMPALPTLGGSGRTGGRGSGRGRVGPGTGGGPGRGGAGLKMPSLGGGSRGRAGGRSGGIKIPSLGGGRGRTASTRSDAGAGTGRSQRKGTAGARTRTNGTRPSTTRAGTATTGAASAGGGPSRRTNPNPMRRVMRWANNRTGGRAGRALDRMGRWADHRTGGRARRAARAAGRAVNHATTPHRPPRWVAMALGATAVLTGAMSPWLAAILGGASAAGGLTYWVIRKRRSRASETKTDENTNETGQPQTGQPGEAKTDGPATATPGTTPHAGGAGDRNRAGADTTTGPSPDPTVGPGGVRFRAAIPGYTPTTGRSTSMTSRLPMVPLAIDMHGAMAKYLPRNMWEVAADLGDLHIVPAHVATSLRAYANTLSAQYPIHSDVITEMGQMYKRLNELSSQAVQMSAMFNKIHEDDIKRRVAPRRGEEKWDLKA